jgi:glycosyltransferase involved in cell wall biosynthesis
MAVYNGQKYLKEAIDSVLRQSFPDFEFIIVDDCSSDNTQLIIKSYDDKRIILIRNKVNKGQTPSLNIAVSKSRGAYLARMDADDIYIPNKLEVQFKFMQENKNISVCGTMSNCIDEYGNIYSNRSFPTNPTDIYFRMFYHSPINHVSVIMRTSDIKKVGSYDESYPICADFALWSKLIRHNYIIANIPLMLTKFRVHTRSLTVENKLGKSSEETAQIIYNNISTLLKMDISKSSCRNIVLMLWPAENIHIIELIKAYLNLVDIAKKVYLNKIPYKISFSIKILLLKSLVKRGLYNKSNKNFKLFLKDLANIFKFYYQSPILILITSISFCTILCFNEKRIKFFKLTNSL